MNPTTESATRLRLADPPSRNTVLDGSWWPRSTDVAAELPALVQALADLRGAITHVLLNPAEWDLPHPSRAAGGRSAARLGWYTSQPAGLITIMSDFGRDRFDLLVIPPDSSPVSADTASAAAVDAGDRRHTPELLAALNHTG
ncbi:hypothetical protein ACTI_19600 [Actinoplanes sp. OR16]|uniref:DUF5994 family protein n=1 Tax=Actinoplanes sp. OR16 TaxID=946334 RepID=UPI000F6E49B5|nr:DUF5994 family protein [Actinoplanes sp. OR16]BBH65275.1 hypothetical protein ACTI_19600 [Actinoplanes sp. OR16]